MIPEVVRQNNLRVSTSTIASYNHIEADQLDRGHSASAVRVNEAGGDPRRSLTTSQLHERGQQANLISESAGRVNEAGINEVGRELDPRRSFSSSIVGENVLDERNNDTHLTINR